MKTKTGSFTLGFRRGWSDWQADDDLLLAFLKENNIGAIDLFKNADQIGQKFLDAGIRLGSVDLPDWSGVISANADTRKKAVAANAEYIQACAKLGPVNHFVVMGAEDRTLPNKENFDYMVESYKELIPVFEEANAKLVIEGCPGQGVLCATPESYRAFFDACGTDAYGINYDPSHLIRQGIDPIRFLHEFASRAFHVHAKDTEVFPEALYEFGFMQQPTLAEERGFGGSYWRYAVPGHGEMRWTEGLKILADNGYSGCICVELEDENFNGSDDGEKRGLLAGVHFLEHA